MKRITILILSLVLLLQLSACAPEIGSTGTFDSSEMPHTEDISEPDGADTNSKVNEQQMTYEKFDFDKKTVRLNSGYEMPIIGLGTWTLSDEEAEESVYQALKVGMRLIDTARYYGNEVGVGRGLQKAIDEGIVTREDVFVTSKIYGGDYERAKGIIDDAIKDLNVEVLL